MCEQELLILFKHKIRRKYFDPYKLLCAMDLAGGVCSYTAYDIIRSVVLAVDKADDLRGDDETVASNQTTNKPKVRTGYCIMPSTSILKRCLCREG